MQILIALTILVTLALLGSSRRFYAWRRGRLGAALTTGGWLFVLIGVLLGEHGLGLVDRDQLQTVQPLLHFCLGWVGLMIGLQMDRRLPTALPAPVRWITIVDWGLSLVVFTGIAALVLIGFGGWSWGTGAVCALFGVAGVGWAADVRTIRRKGGSSEQLSRMIRAVSGLGGILAVIAYGLVFKSFEIDSSGSIVGLSAGNTVVGAGVSLGIGLGMGLIGKWLTGVAGRGASEFLVVLLGLTALLSGAAATMGYSPVFVALWAGALICNLQGTSLEPMKRVIIEAEQPIAMALMLVAGVLLDPTIGLAGWALIAALSAGRAIVKSAVGKFGVKPALEDAPRNTTMVALVRQNPLAIALATGFAISAYGMPDSGSPLAEGGVVTVVVMVGLIGEFWALLRGPRDPGTSNAERAADPTPDLPPAEAPQP